MSSQQSDPQNPNPQMKRRRRGDSRSSTQTPRYVCYCNKVYLSYPALYLHLKNKHPQCFLNNRKIQATKFKESFTSDGYRILRMERDVTEPKISQGYGKEHGFQAKNVLSFPYQSYNQFPYSSPQNFVMPPMDSKSFYMQNPLNSMQMPKKIPQSMLSCHPIPQNVSKSRTDLKPESQISIQTINIQSQNILTMINLFIEQRISEQQLEKREIIELELLFSLLPKFIEQKSQRLRALHNIEENSHLPLVKHTDLKYLESVLGYFRDFYVKEFVERQKCLDETILSREENFRKAMVKLNRYFNDIDLASKQIQKFSQWLIHQHRIQRVQLNLTL